MSIRSVDVRQGLSRLGSGWDWCTTSRDYEHFRTECSWAGAAAERRGLRDACPEVAVEYSGESLCLTIDTTEAPAGGHRGVYVVRATRPALDCGEPPLYLIAKVGWPHQSLESQQLGGRLSPFWARLPHWVIGQEEFRALIGHPVYRLKFEKGWSAVRYE